MSDNKYSLHEAKEILLERKTIGRTFTLAEAREIFTEHDRQRGLHKTISKQQDTISLLRVLNKRAKAAHKRRVVMTHRLTKHLDWCQEVIALLKREDPRLVETVSSLLRKESEDIQRERANTFRRARCERRQRQAARKAAKVAELA